MNTSKFLNLISRINLLILITTFSFVVLLIGLNSFITTIQIVYKIQFLAIFIFDLNCVLFLLLNLKYSESQLKNCFMVFSVIFIGITSIGFLYNLYTQFVLIKNWSKLKVWKVKRRQKPASCCILTSPKSWLIVEAASSRFSEGLKLRRVQTGIK